MPKGKRRPDYARTALYAKRRQQVTASGGEAEAALWEKIADYCSKKVPPLGEEESPLEPARRPPRVYDLASLHALCLAESHGDAYWSKVVAEAILSLLSSTQRVVYLLVSGDRLSTVETAEALGVAPGTVAGLVARARHRIDADIYAVVRESLEGRSESAQGDDLADLLRQLDYPSGPLWLVR